MWTDGAMNPSAIATCTAGSPIPSFASQLTPQSEVRLTTTHTFSSAGTFFPAVRVASQRDGHTTTRYALARNLARVRVVVTA
jgi:hypothetical protein